MVDKTKAKEFFLQLEDFSREYLRRLRVSPKSPWGKDTFSRKESPRGAILHYTADTFLDISLKWFCKESFNAKSSAHVVVSDRKLGSANELVASYPLIADLPVTVVQTRSPYEMAWHATWVNGFAYGIENTNAGELRREPETGRLMHWRPAEPGAPDWTMPWEGHTKEPIEMAGKIWDNFPARQVAANITILRHLNALHEGSLKAPWILGHEQVQGVHTLRGGGRPMKTDKRDPGPSFPLHDVRYSVLAHDLESIQWLSRYEAMPDYCDQERSSYVIDVIQHVAGVRPSHAVAWQRFNSLLQSFPEIDGFGVVGKLVLKLLGYHVTSLLTTELDSDDLQSIWIFQKLMGLEPDTKPGPQTKRAMVARLKDRGLLENGKSVA